MGVVLLKKSLLLMITAILSLSVFAGCSSDKTASKADLTVWSFTDELQEPINVFKEKNGVTVDLTIIPIEDYPTRLRPVLESGIGAPDVFTGELAFIKDWVEQDYWEDLSQEPYNVQDWEEDYVPYVFDLGKDSKGKIKAVSWQTTPC